MLPEELILSFGYKSTADVVNNLGSDKEDEQNVKIGMRRLSRFLLLPLQEVE